MDNKPTTKRFRATFRQSTDGKLAFVWGQHHSVEQFIEILTIRANRKGEPLHELEIIHEMSLDNIVVVEHRNLINL